VRALQFDEAKLITGSTDHTIQVWNWRSGECIRTLDGHTDGVVSLNFDSNVLASGSVDITVKVWKGWGVDDVWIEWRAEDMSREAVVFGFGWWEYSSLGPCMTDVRACLHNPSLPHWSTTMSTKYGCSAHHGVPLSYPSEH
jgi:WD40 repeat protein